MKTSDSTSRQLGLAFALALVVGVTPLFDAQSAFAMGGGGSAGGGPSMAGGSGSAGSHGGYLKFKGGRANAVVGQETITAIPNRNDSSNGTGLGYNGGYYGQGVYAPYDKTACLRRIEGAGGPHDYRVC